MQCGRNKVKVYLCLFTCTTTRAIYLEIVQDLTVESFLLTYRKFAARRSVPRIMISDNGSTFRSSAEDLQSLIALPEVQEELSKSCVAWKFIPKRPPLVWRVLVTLSKFNKISTQEEFGKTTHIFDTNGNSHRQNWSGDQWPPSYIYFVQTWWCGATHPSSPAAW